MAELSFEIDLANATPPTRKAGTVHIGERVEWTHVDTVASAPGGWLQCAALPSLPPGLTMDDAARVRTRARSRAPEICLFSDHCFAASTPPIRGTILVQNRRRLDPVRQ